MNLPPDRDHFFIPPPITGSLGETPTRVLEGGEASILPMRTVERAPTLRGNFTALMLVMVAREIAGCGQSRRANLLYYHAYVGHGTEVSITLAKMIIDQAPRPYELCLFLAPSWLGCE